MISESRTTLMLCGSRGYVIGFVGRFLKRRAGNEHVKGKTKSYVTGNPDRAKVPVRFCSHFFISPRFPLLVSSSPLPVSDLITFVPWWKLFQIQYTIALVHSPEFIFINKIQKIILLF